jgi:hypothetical protein
MSLNTGLEQSFFANASGFVYFLAGISISVELKHLLSDDALSAYFRVLGSEVEDPCRFIRHRPNRLRASESS